MPNSQVINSPHRFSHARRLRAVLLAGLIGWLAGFLFSTPAMMVIAWRNSEHEPSVFFATLGSGLIVWAACTLILSLASWLVVAVPAALLLPPRWLVRHRPLVLLLTFVLTFGVVTLKLLPFQDQAASQILLRFVLYMPYGSFALLFALGTAWFYTGSLARSTPPNNPAE